MSIPTSAKAVNTYSGERNVNVRPHWHLTQYTQQHLCTVRSDEGKANPDSPEKPEKIQGRPCIFSIHTSHQGDPNSGLRIMQIKYGIFIFIYSLYPTISPSNSRLWIKVFFSFPFLSSDRLDTQVVKDHSISSDLEAQDHSMSFMAERRSEPGSPCL